MTDDTSAHANAQVEIAYLAAIVESSDDAIISKDLNGIVRSCNAAAERMFGYSAAELVGQPIRLIIPADRQAEEDDIIGRIRAGQGVEHFQTVRRAKDGRLLDVSLTVSPVRDSTGRVVGASKIARDITEQKRAACRA
jgi:PAS domain S-box-containing protein